MRLRLQHDLPLVAVTVVHRGASVEISDVLVDTGSASTVLSADVVASIGIVPESGDRLRTLRGVGGRELVFTRRVDRLELDGHGLDGFEVEIAGRHKMSVRDTMRRRIAGGRARAPLIQA